MTDLIGDMRRQIGQSRISVEHRIAKRDRENFVVHRTVVAHGKISDRIDPHQAHRANWLAAQNQHVQRISVIGIGARDKAVIGRVVRRGVEDPVQPQRTGLLVQLIFVFEPFSISITTRKSSGCIRSGLISCHKFIGRPPFSCAFFFTFIVSNTALFVK